MKPRVLHIIDSFETGGTERQAIQLMRLLQTSGRYHIQLGCLQKRGELLAEVETLGFGDIEEYPLSSFYDRNMLSQVRRCVRFLKDNEISVVHTHDFYTNIFGMVAARLAGVPVRIASKRETNGLLSPRQKQVERYAYRFAQAIITNAEAVKTQLASEGVSDGKLAVVYNGLDMKRVMPSADIDRAETLARLNLPNDADRRFVTILANVQHAVKDHPTFLRAAARVHKAVPEAAFVVAGEGRLMGELRSLATELGIGKDTFFIGRCTRVAELLAVSSVGVLSSKAEGFSNSILEYMAAALPVVATDVGGAREAMIDGETGFIVLSGDDETMAAKITMLLQEPERAAAMGHHGRSIVQEKFSCEAQLARTSALYDSLLAQPTSSATPALNNLLRKSA